MIPFESLLRVNEPYHAALRAALEEVLASGRYVLGGKVAAFEARLAGSLGVARAVGVGSGYDALTLALRALGCTRGEIILPSNTYMATILAAVRCGLTPVLAEPDPKTFLIDPDRVEALVTPRTVALLPVHLFGLVCDMDALGEVARRKGLVVVEDCAQAQGGLFRGRAVGSLGHAGALSFYPTKNLGALGDAGAVATDDANVAERLETLRNYGSKERAQAAEVGLNSRLDELQAAFLLVKLDGLTALVARKNALAERYDRGLHPAFARPVAAAGSTPARSVYPVLHPRRDALQSHLAARGIGTEIHYPVPPHRQEALRDLVDGEFPIAEALHRQTLSLPLSAGMTDGEADTVIAAANAFAEGA